MTAASAGIAAKIDADTPFIILGSEEGTPTKIVQPGDVITSSRLVYTYLAVVDEDVYGTDGKVIGGGNKLLLPKGAQLFGVMAKNGQITYCSVDHKPVGPGEGIFVMNHDKHTCFIDADHDGRFDSSYDLRTKFASTPIYYDAEQGGNPLKKSVSYRIVDPLECKLPFRIEILLSRLYENGAKAVVSVRLRSGKNEDYLSESAKGMITKINSFKVLNSEFSLIRADDKSARLTIVKGIERGSLTTIRPTIFFQFF